MNGKDFQSIHTGLVKYVLNPQNDYFESDVRIYLFYNTSQVLCKSGISATMNLSGKGNVFSELAYPSFGYVMTFDKKIPDNRLVDITFFKNYKYNQWLDIPLKMFVLPVYTRMPGDYRSEEEVKKTIEENLLKRKTT
jgi:hypothetical protein